MIEKNCESYGFVEKDNKIVSRDMLLKRNEGVFTISVGLPYFVKEIRSKNQSLPAHLQEDDNIFLLDDVSDPDAICQRLGSLPFEDIKPFLSLQQE